MKILRVALLTATLLVTASPRPIPSATALMPTTQQTIARHSTGDCYFINGVWICDPG